MKGKKSNLICLKGLESVKDLLSMGAYCGVGLGNDILVWEDPWVPDLPSFKPQPKDSQTLRQSLVVSQLMNQDKSWWDVVVLKNLFEEVSVQAFQ